MFYSGINSQEGLFHDFIIQEVDSSSSIESSYTWRNLIEGDYQFSVTAFTNHGRGETASLMLSTSSTLPNNGNFILYSIYT